MAQMRAFAWIPFSLGSIGVGALAYRLGARKAENEHREIVMARSNAASQKPSDLCVPCHAAMLHPHPPTPTETPPPEEEELLPTLDSSRTRESTKHGVTAYSSSGDIIMAFGPGSNYFLGVRGQGFCLSASKTGLYFSHVKHKDNMGRPYLWAFSPHGDEYGVYYDERTKSVSCVFRTSGISNSPSYQSLRNWLVGNVVANESSVLHTTVIFGPGASYYARSGDKCTWHDLPTRLEETIKQRKAEYEDSISKTESQADADENSPACEDMPSWIPRILALGAGDTYFAAWPDDETVWSLNTGTDLWRKLKRDELEVGTLASVTLSPTNTQAYTSLQKDGTVCYSFPTDIDDTPVNKLMAYLQMRAREDGTTFPRRRGGKTIETFEITPNTHFDESNLKIPSPALQKAITLTVSIPSWQWIKSWF